MAYLQVTAARRGVSWYKKAGSRVSFHTTCSRSLFRTGTWNKRKTNNRPQTASCSRLCYSILFQVNQLKVDLEQKMCVSLPCSRAPERCHGVREVVRDSGRTPERRTGVREVVRDSGRTPERRTGVREVQRQWPCTREASRCTRSDRNQPSSSPPRPRTSNILYLLEIEEGYKTGKLQDLIDFVFDILEYHSGTVGFAVFEDTKQDTKSA